jgi:CMP-N,N'-diacetyllegionaminic acid synthase
MHVAIIPARGGSKRLPRKNIRMFCGKPLIAWSILQALNSYFIDDVYVSTDDLEIADIAKEFGAKVIMRPEWDDADSASATRPILHAIAEIKKILHREEKALDLIIPILPTNPLNKPGDFDRAIYCFKKFGFDTLVPKINKRELTVAKKTGWNRYRTEFFSKHFEYVTDAGEWCVTTPAWYETMCSLQKSDKDLDQDEISNWPSLEGNYIDLEYWQYADTDTAEEFKFAELVMEHYILKGNGASVYSDYRSSDIEVNAMVSKYSVETNPFLREKAEPDTPQHTEEYLDELVKQYTGNNNQL